MPSVQSPGFSPANADFQSETLKASMEKELVLALCPALKMIFP